MLRSLRTRLTMLSVIVLGLALAASAVGLHAQLGSTLLGPIQDTGRDEAKIAAAHADAGEFAAAGKSGEATDTVVQVVHDGTVVAASHNAAGRPDLFGFTTSTHVRFHDTGALTVHQSADLYLVAAIRSANGYDVYVAVASDDRHDSLRALDSALWVGVPIVIAVMAVIAWFIIGRALGPVERLRRQAGAMSAADLSQRLSRPPTTELAALADTLNDLLERLDKSSRTQRAFVADAAHELRSPLASLRTQLDVAAESSQPVDAAALRDEVVRLINLAEDLLHLARLDAGAAPATRAVDVDDVVLEVVQELRSASTVRIDPSDVSAAQVDGDRPALARLVRNLVDNACRHASSAVKVSLAVEGDEAVLTVADDGPGVPPEARATIFERFTRLDDSRGRSAGGFGLGLAIAREVARAHGGDITIADDGPGATFVVRLPTGRVNAIGVERVGSV
jgi:signal transduction histidine kinase